MRLSSWLRSARARFVPDGTQKRLTTRAPSTRLSVEPLEDRVVPSTFTVQNLADSGAGSLRAAVAAARRLPQAPAGIIGFDDYPGTLLARAIGERLGLPGPSLRASVLCSHKAWCRVVQQRVAPHPA